LASVISDIFGKSGMYLLNCVLEGRDIDEIIEGIPSGRLKKKADQIKESIKSRLVFSFQNNIAIFLYQELNLISCHL